MNSAYNINLYKTKGQQLIKKTFAGSLECPLYIGLTVYYSYKE